MKFLTALLAAAALLVSTAAAQDSLTLHSWVTTEVDSEGVPANWQTLPDSQTVTDPETGKPMGTLVFTPANALRHHFRFQGEYIDGTVTAMSVVLSIDLTMIPVPRYVPDPANPNVLRIEVLMTPQVSNVAPSNNRTPASR